MQASSGREQIERNKIWRVVNQQQLRQTISEELFTFDRIYDEKMTTPAIFEEHFKHMIDQAVHGYSVTIFAYGQTSSGKTHTMNGTQEEEGLIPLAAKQIFERTQKESAAPKSS